MATAYSVYFHTLFKTVAHPASASMSVLEMAISCFKVVPAFGLLLFLHQSSSHETLISVVGCLFPPQGSNAEYLQPLKGFEMLPFWSGHFCLPLSGNGNCMEHPSFSFLQDYSLSLVLKHCAADPGLEQCETVPCNLI